MLRLPPHLAALFLSTVILRAAPGDLDPTYGRDGLATLYLNEDGVRIRNAALQGDDKLVVVGTAGFSVTEFAVARFNADGSPDTTFSQDGKVLTRLSAGHNSGQDVAIQRDGKIVVAGFAFGGSDADFAVVRYRADGSLDASFGDHGKVIAAVSNGHDTSYGLALQPDGKMVMVGRASGDIAVIRLMPDGAPDRSFGDDGKAITDIGGVHDGAAAVVLQRDGKIVVAGHAQRGSAFDVAVARYHVDGSLDTSFGHGGKVVTAGGASTSPKWGAQGLVLQPDQKILVVGKAWNGTGGDIACVRYHTDGSLDGTFGQEGVLLIHAGPQRDITRSITVQGDGKILIASVLLIDSMPDIALIRRNPDGSPDIYFGGGIVNTTIGATYPSASAAALLLQSDGKILVVGTSGNDIAVLRYESGWRPHPRARR